MTRGSRTVLAGLACLPTMAAAADAPWYERIELAGDLRLRYEAIREEQSADRDRGRYRARLGLVAQAADDIDLVFRVATGDGSPVSTNLTFDEGFSASELRIDRAYVAWRINDSATFYGGKMKGPWFRSGSNALLWDSDLNPEGVALALQSQRLFGSVAALAIEERAAGGDSWLLSAQGGIDLSSGSGTRLRAGAGYFDYSRTIGNAPFYDGSPNGNSVDAAGNYLFAYTLIELFAEYRTALGELPLTVFADWVRNADAGSEDSAYLVGAKFGTADAAGRFEFAYSWQDTGADAVIGTYNDSDFAGGNTDAAGHLLEAAYALHDHVSLGATVIVAERGAFAGNERDYDRVMLDIEFSFE